MSFISSDRHSPAKVRISAALSPDIHLSYEQLRNRLNDSKGNDFAQRFNDTCAHLNLELSKKVVADDERPTEWYAMDRSFRRTLNVLKQVGLKLLEGVSEDAALTMVTEARRKSADTVIPYLERAWPHIRAFRTAPVQGRKVRVVQFSGDDPIDSGTNAVCTVLKYFDLAKIREKRLDLSWPEGSLERLNNIPMIRHGLEVFMESGGGPDFLLFARPKTGSSLKPKDVGVFDKCCVVTSTEQATPHEGLYRNVTFSYYSDLGECDHAKFLYDCLKGSNVIEVVSSSEFLARLVR